MHSQVAECVTWCVRSLLGDPLPALTSDQAAQLHRDTKGVLLDVGKALSCHWPIMSPALVQTRFKDAVERIRKRALENGRLRHATRT